MKHVTFILLLLFSTLFYGQQYFPVQVDFKDGTSKTGYATVPRELQNKVKFKSSDGDKATKLNGDDIYTLTFTVEDGRTYLLERSHVRTIIANKNGEMFDRVSKWSGWYLRKYSDSRLYLYYGGDKYKIDKNGDLTVKSSGQVGFTEISFYLKRPGENEITYISAAESSGIQGNQGRIFRNVLSVYMEDKPELAERIRNKEFKSYQLIDVYKIYIADQG